MASLMFVVLTRFLLVDGGAFVVFVSIAAVMTPNYDSVSVSFTDYITDVVPTRVTTIIDEVGTIITVVLLIFALFIETTQDQEVFQSTTVLIIVDLMHTSFDSVVTENLWRFVHPSLKKSSLVSVTFPTAGLDVFRTIANFDDYSTVSIGCGGWETVFSRISGLVLKVFLGLTIR